MKKCISILAALAFCASPPLGGDLAGGTAAAASIGVGEDGFRVPAGPNNVFDLSGSPIPADFFGPGSDPLLPTIFVEGATGGVDAVVRRLNSTVDLDPPPQTDTIDIEIVALNLVSVSPITVTFNGGQNPQLWDVAVDLSTLTPPPGRMTITKQDPNGGIFKADFLVQPRFTFAEVGNPLNLRLLDTGLEGFLPLPYDLMAPAPAPWSTASPFPPPAPPGGDFFPGVAGGVPQPLVFDVVGSGDRLELVLHPVPEPATFTLLALAGLALGARSLSRRRLCK